MKLLKPAKGYPKDLDHKHFWCEKCKAGLFFYQCRARQEYESPCAHNCVLKYEVNKAYVKEKKKGNGSHDKNKR